MIVTVATWVFMALAAIAFVAAIVMALRVAARGTYVFIAEILGSEEQKDMGTAVSGNPKPIVWCRLTLRMPDGREVELDVRHCPGGRTIRVIEEPGKPMIPWQRALLPAQVAVVIGATFALCATLMQVGPF
jgi:ABC-type Fe3+-siderophore transport system permease subunit